MSTSPGRPPPPSANSTTGSLPPLGEVEQPVLLQVVAHPLRAREHRVVVGHRHARLAIDLADAADKPVGGRSRDQLLARCGAAPGRRTAAARTRRSCPRRAGRRGSRARCAARARGGARRPRGAPRRARPRGARGPRAGPRARRRGDRPRGSRAGSAARAAPASSSAAAGPPRPRRRPTPRGSRPCRRVSASTSCSIFIASSTTSGTPSPTWPSPWSETTTPAKGAVDADLGRCGHFQIIAHRGRN